MTDEIITEMFLRRSEDAIAEAERKYGRYLYAVAAGILKNGEDAKETVNEVLLKAWRAIPPERPCDLRAYLASLARRTALNRLEAESAAKRGGGVLREALDELSECVGGNCDDFTEEIFLKNTLNSFVRSLPDEARRFFIRRYWHMDTVAEIAKRYSCGESRVKSSLSRTREKLKRRLKKEGYSI